MLTPGLRQKNYWMNLEHLVVQGRYKEVLKCDGNTWKDYKNQPEGTQNVQSQNNVYNKITMTVLANNP